MKSSVFVLTWISGPFRYQIPIYCITNEFIFSSLKMPTIKWIHSNWSQKKGICTYCPIMCLGKTSCKSMDTVRHISPRSCCWNGRKNSCKRIKKEVASCIRSLFYSKTRNHLKHQTFVCVCVCMNGVNIANDRNTNHSKRNCQETFQEEQAPNIVAIMCCLNSITKFSNKLVLIFMPLRTGISWRIHASLCRQC